MTIMDQLVWFLEVALDAQSTLPAAATDLICWSMLSAMHS